MKYCNHCMTQLNETSEKCPKCGRVNHLANIPVHHLVPGTILNNKFYVGEALGEGGFGITYIGLDTRLNMKVAIKEFYPNGCVSRNNTYSPEIANSATDERRDFFLKGKTRFLQEAQVLAKFCDEPGIVGVRDFFEENNTAYIIMEFLDGITLKDHLRNNGVLSAEKTVELLMPVMMSLKKVHEQGMIHRDISPDNIMLVGNKVKLLDFGAARNVSANENKSLSIMLKPGYAPEEQYRSKGNQGPWTDVYALCATMYKCITGITPDDSTQRAYRDEVRKPSQLGVRIPANMETVIMKGMSVHQESRFRNMDALINAFNQKEINTPKVVPPAGYTPPVQPQVARPVTPVAPVTPVVNPVTPVAPVTPVVNPVTPVAPVRPVNPVTPVNNPTPVYNQPIPQKKSNKIKALVISIVGILIFAALGIGVALIEQEYNTPYVYDDTVNTTETTTEAPKGDATHDGRLIGTWNGSEVGNIEGYDMTFAIMYNFYEDGTVKVEYDWDTYQSEMTNLLIQSVMSSYGVSESYARQVIEESLGMTIEEYVAQEYGDVSTLDTGVWSTDGTTLTIEVTRDDGSVEETRLEYSFSSDENTLFTDGVSADLEVVGTYARVN